MNKLEELVNILEETSSATRKDILSGFIKLVDAYDNRDAFNDLMFMDYISKESLICMLYKLTIFKHISVSVIGHTCYSAIKDIPKMERATIIKLVSKDKFTIISYIRRLRECAYVQRTAKIYVIARTSDNSILNQFPNLEYAAKIIKMDLPIETFKEVALLFKRLKCMSSDYVELVIGKSSLSFDDLRNIDKRNSSLSKQDVQKLCVQFLWADDR